MKVYLEVIIFLFLLFMFLVWLVWYKLSGWWLRRKYSPEKDLSKKIQNDRSEKGGIFNSTTDGTEDNRIDTITIDSIGSKQSERRELLPKTETSDAGENSPSTGKNRGNIKRRFFRRKMHS